MTLKAIQPAKGTISAFCQTGNCNFCRVEGCTHDCSHIYAPEYSAEDRAMLDAQRAFFEERRAVTVSNTAALNAAVGGDSESSEAVSTVAATPKQIRAWAVANGWPSLAGQRGRLPREVFPAFAAAHQG